MLRDLIALPGVLVIDECPWKRVLDYWPAPLSSLADAAIAAVAASNRYDAIATFDQKLSKRAKTSPFLVLVTTNNAISHTFTRYREQENVSRDVKRAQCA